MLFAGAALAQADAPAALPVQIDSPAQICRSELRDPAIRVEACTAALATLPAESAPARAELLRYRALAHRAGGSIEDALADLDEAVNVQPDHTGAWLIRAVLRAELGQIDKALADIEEAQRLSPRSPQVWRHQGVLLDKKGEFDRAYAALNQALELDPRYAEAYFDRGDMLRREGYLAEALDDLSTAIELDPLLAKAWNARGSTWANLDDDKHARADFDRAIQLMPDFAAAYVNRGSIRWRMADHDGAMDDYGHAIELEPNNVEAWLNRARAFEAQGRMDEARHDMEMAQALGARRQHAEDLADRPEPGPTQEGAYYVAIRPVNYRAAPSTRAERLGSLARGDRVQVVGEKSGWMAIRVPDHGVAYVWRDFLELPH